MADDVEEEPSVAPGIPERPVRQPADRQTAQDERPCAERDLLDALVSVLPDKFYGAGLAQRHQ
jgi:hypothetical protein